MSSKSKNSGGDSKLLCGVVSIVGLAGVIYYASNIYRLVTKGCWNEPCQQNVDTVYIEQECSQSMGVMETQSSHQNTQESKNELQRLNSTIQNHQQQPTKENPRKYQQSQAQTVEEYSILEYIPRKHTAAKVQEDDPLWSTQKDTLYQSPTQASQDAEANQESKPDQNEELNASQYMIYHQCQSTQESKNEQGHGSYVKNAKQSEKNVRVIDNPEYDRSEITTHPTMIFAELYSGE